jgi:uncharacterized DUF497 family protein
MRERGIAVEEILSIVYEQTEVVVVGSDRDENIDLYFGRVGHSYWLVVCNNQTQALITVRKMRPAEKKKFEELIHNEK